MEKNLLKSIEIAALQGIPASVEDALEVREKFSLDEICDAADRVRQARVGSVIDTCSIVNARSGRCSEDCKWCAQSRFHATGVTEYEIVPHEEFEQHLDLSHRRGVGRFSLVTSGRKVAPADIQRFCDLYREATSKSDISLCASMGLLTKDELQQLKDAGVARYHCNLETSSDYFPTLCSTHSHDDKLRTIRAAREVGMEVCSGGIIGMGETMRQRLTMAQEARQAGATSIPINILNPIPGTPLEGTPLILEEEVILTVALMRFIAPDCTLRFAGGRSRLSSQANARILRGGMNGALVGDMLTTVGNNIDQDYALFASHGFTLPREDRG
ncbi:MAG: biotin synthase BioB [Bacteroidales bacterium]|nr:biotin synthase BioB [Bacteroidales bacterium]